METYHVVESNGLRMNLMEQTLYYQDKEILLTNKEFKTLHVFMRFSGRVLSKGQIYELTEGTEQRDYERRIEMRIYRLRKKLFDATGKEDFIVTVRERGYRFKA